MYKLLQMLCQCLYHLNYLLLATLITLQGIKNARMITASSSGYSIIPFINARSRANEMITIKPSNNWNKVKYIYMVYAFYILMLCYLPTFDWNNKSQSLNILTNCKYHMIRQNRHHHRLVDGYVNFLFPKF